MPCRTASTRLCHPPSPPPPPQCALCMREGSVVHNLYAKAGQCVAVQLWPLHPSGGTSRCLDMNPRFSCFCFKRRAGRHPQVEAFFRLAGCIVTVVAWSGCHGTCVTQPDCSGRATTCGDGCGSMGTNESLDCQQAGLAARHSHLACGPHWSAAGSVWRVVLPCSAQHSTCSGSGDCCVLPWLCLPLLASLMVAWLLLRHGQVGLAASASCR